mmetsp:Transcript_27272/g.66335  ORF Transcript_27272/g.66335 Transcript_27272/m.66335 type:complete len:160 (+) Transcript_27272:121-600(+)
MLGRYKGRTVIVTDANTVEGGRIARSLASSGANVVATAERKKLTSLDGLMSDIKNDKGAAIAVYGSLDSEKDNKRLVIESIKAFGATELVLFHAGEKTRDAWRKSYQINAFGCSYRMHFSKYSERTNSTKTETLIKRQLDISTHSTLHVLLSPTNRAAA